LDKVEIIKFLQSIPFGPLKYMFLLLLECDAKLDSIWTIPDLEIYPVILAGPI